MSSGLAGDITECRFVPYRDQQHYLDDGWTITPQRGPHAAYGVIASRPIPDSNHAPQTLPPYP